LKNCGLILRANHVWRSLPISLSQQVNEYER
jgi:hypothetical protein